MNGDRPLDVFLVAGEDSGDQLGGRLMAALAERLGGRVRFRGVGGAGMKAQGLDSRFPMEDLTAMGLNAVLARLPLILQRLRETVVAITVRPPDLLVLIDSPDFTYRVAKRVRRELPDLPIVKYVSPTVWVWRPGRARAMRPHVDHILALFPFEPAEHERLGGPPCTYVGHPLLERLDALRPSVQEAIGRRRDPPVVLVLPGSRSSEIERLAPVFAAALGRVAAARPDAQFVLPAVPARAEQVRAASAAWPVTPEIVSDEAGKHAAFRRARAALAASGTVTLELALAQVPMVAAYKVTRIEAAIARRLFRSHSVILPNLILGENAVPEFLQEDCTADGLAGALLPLIDEGAARQRQLEAFARLDAALDTGGEIPSVRAARVLLEVYERKTGRKLP